LAKGGLGKVDRDFLARVLLRNTGAASPAVLAGPALGLDNAVISLGKGRVMVVTADPLSIIPSIGMDDSAWLTVHELASDLATSGVAPQFAVLDYNLPPSLEQEDFEDYAIAVSEECRRLGVSIVGGHTGWYPGCDYSIVGGGMMMAMADDDAYVTPRMIQGGDEVIMTKGAAVEAAAVLALSFPETTEKRVGTKVARSAKGNLRSCSTVDDALTASSAGVRSEGVTSMHDATEGGVLGGLYELARTSRKALIVEREKIHVPRVNRLVCEAFGLDPLATISEGTLLITCRPKRSREVLRRLSAKEIAAYVIGRVEARGPKLWLSEGGSRRSYAPPKLDSYWKVYAEGVKRGWK
jgi:hydrogenase expression/formation protein HypE